MGAKWIHAWQAYLRVPDPSVEYVFRERLKLYGLMPAPLPHDGEEAHENVRANGIGVELAETSDHQGPSNTAGKAHDIGVDGTALSPQLDCSQGISEGLLLRHKLQHDVTDTSAVDGSTVNIVKATKQRIILEREG